MTDQIVRALRFIAANNAEGWGKRIYENEFKKHLIMAWAYWKNQSYGCGLQKIADILRLKPVIPSL